MNIYNLVCTVSLALSIVACGPVSRTITEDKVLGNTDGMVRLDTKDKYTLVYKRNDFLITDYSKFKISPVRTIIIKGDESSSGITAEEKLKFEEYLRNAVRRELTEGGYSVVKTSGPDVLGIQFTLTNIDSGNPYLNLLQFYGPGISLDVGGVSIETEFFDTTNYKPLAIAVIGADGARKFSVESVDGYWGDVEKIFDDWAAGFRNLLDMRNESLKSEQR